jgi:hypothetical protein
VDQIWNYGPARGDARDSGRFGALFDRAAEALLVGRRVGMFHLVCYLREGDRVFETYWTTGRGVEAMDNNFRLMDLTVYGRQQPWEDSPAASPPSRALRRPRKRGAMIASAQALVLIARQAAAREAPSHFNGARRARRRDRRRGDRSRRTRLRDDAQTGLGPVRAHPARGRRSLQSTRFASSPHALAHARSKRSDSSRNHSPCIDASRTG